jgi:hypothetical protein
VAFGLSFGFQSFKAASTSARDFSALASALARNFSSLLTRTNTPLGLRVPSPSSISPSSSSSSPAFFFAPRFVFAFAFVFVESSNAAFATAATPLNACVFRIFAGGGSHFNGGRGINNGNKSGDNPLGCVIAIPRNCPGIGRPPMPAGGIIIGPGPPIAIIGGAPRIIIGGGAPPPPIIIGGAPPPPNPPPPPRIGACSTPNCGASASPPPNPAPPCAASVGGAPASAPGTDVAGARAPCAAPGGGGGTFCMSTRARRGGEWRANASSIGHGSCIIAYKTDTRAI